MKNLGVYRSFANTHTNIGNLGDGKSSISISPDGSSSALIDLTSSVLLKQRFNEIIDQ